MGIAAGVAFLVCGFFVYKAPVPTTLTGLIGYLAIQAAGVVFDPANLRRGIILKILIIIGLAKAVQAAFAYAKEQKMNQMPGGYPPGV